MRQSLSMVILQSSTTSQLSVQLFMKLQVKNHSIFEDDINGSVNTVFHDNGLIYLGGDFKFNNTYSAAVYNISAEKVESTLFQGFGENSVVNTIAKILNNKNDDDSEENDQLGSIVFGGQFDTLGLSDLLVHNITTNKTKTPIQVTLPLSVLNN